MGRASFAFADLVAPAVAARASGPDGRRGRRRFAPVAAQVFAKHPSSARSSQAGRQRSLDWRSYRARRSRRDAGHIATEGAAGFYSGPVAQKIVAAVQAAGGRMTWTTRRYRAVEREPVRGTYRGHTIVSMPPPSSGGAHVIEILKILEGSQLASRASIRPRPCTRWRRPKSSPMPIAPNSWRSDFVKCRSKASSRRPMPKASRAHSPNQARPARTSVPASRSVTKATRRRISRSSTATATRSPTPIR